MLKARYVERYEFGFKQRMRSAFVSWRYNVSAAGNLDGGRSGGLYAKAEVSGATWFNYLWHSDKWDQLSQSARDAVEGSHQLNRGFGDPPTDGAGRWVTGTAYVSGGVAMQREEFRPW